MVNARKIEIDKLYQKIDKIAKVGRDNYINYHIFVDELIRNGHYSLWIETLEIKYDILPKTKVTISDSKGSGAELEPIIVDGHIESIKVINGGLNYSASASVSFIGGIVSASASPVVIASKIYSINIIGSGSSYNSDPKLGTIDEVEVYKVPLPSGATRELYQQLGKNKTIQLIATVDGATQSATFSFWDEDKSFDKNLNLLYSKAIDYLLAPIV
jgi:hypothetical protein